MRVGLQISNYSCANDQCGITDTLISIIERAEQAGLYSLWVMDHFFQVPMFGPVESAMCESWSVLAFAAGRTQRIKLGTLVTGVTYRHPGILVKIATTLDVLTGGRAYLGIGTAWVEEEHRSLGVPFPPTTERFERLEETLQIAHRMWSGDQTVYRGKYYTLERPLNAPQAIQQPHPPILIGGGGERKTLRMVAQYADACNLFAWYGFEVLAHKLSILQEHCQAQHRPYENIEKTTLDTLHITRDGRHRTLSASAVIDRLARFAELGFDQVIINLTNVTEAEPFEVLSADVLPALNTITTGA